MPVRAAGTLAVNGELPTDLPATLITPLADTHRSPARAGRHALTVRYRGPGMISRSKRSSACARRPVPGDLCLAASRPHRETYLGGGPRRNTARGVGGTGHGIRGKGVWASTGCRPATDDNATRRRLRTAQ
ncbi:hypothetical protein GCM10027176_21150 [Actinoallomurus bryophytorum]